MMEIIQIFLLLILLLATLGDLLIPIIIGKNYPNYNHFKDTISTLGTSESPVQKKECLNLILVGILFIIFSLIQWFINSEKTTAHKWYFIGILVFGIGCVLAGLFPEDPINVDETPSGKIHGIASGLGFLFLIASLYWAIKIPELQSLQVYSVISLIVSIISSCFLLLQENLNRVYRPLLGYINALI